MATCHISGSTVLDISQSTVDLFKSMLIQIWVPQDSEPTQKFNINNTKLPISQRTCSYLAYRFLVFQGSNFKRGCTVYRTVWFLQFNQPSDARKKHELLIFEWQCPATARTLWLRVFFSWLRVAFLVVTGGKFQWANLFPHGTISQHWGEWSSVSFMETSVGSCFFCTESVSFRLFFFENFWVVNKICQNHVTVG